MARGNGGSASGTTPGPTSPAMASQMRQMHGVGRYGLSNTARAGEPVTWAEVDPQVIWDAIVAVTAAGDALTFSVTADGGAFSLTVMSGGKADKAWPKSVEDVMTTLQQIAAQAG